ncbi:MAG: flagellar biosynthetic protein FliO [Desulfobacterales bacterium]|nr:flagellar biosynthetic protein FliO [Desulfobacterales bacterium]
MNYEPNMVSALLKMMLALVVVVGGLVGALFYIRKKLKAPGPGGRDRPIKVLATQYLGVKKCISLVEVPGAVLVLGITNEQIRLLDKIEDAAILDQLKGSNTGPGGPMSFSDHLKKWSSNLPLAGKGGKPSKE